MPTARIDYVLLSPELRVRSARVPALPGADHLPRVAEVAPPGSSGVRVARL